MAAVEGGTAAVEYKRVNEKRLLSRLLYTNPVCLCSVKPEDGHANVMTLSWLTPTDNNGGLVFSMNKRRVTASLLDTTATFVLSVPVKGMEATVVHIGSTHGNDKLSRLSIPQCAPGGGEVDKLVAIDGCAAHIVCRLLSRQDADADHWLNFAEIDHAFVKPEYWSGKTFIPQREDVPPYLSFLGSSSFAYVTKA